MSGWIFATCYPVGTLDDYTWSYSWDLTFHANRRAAIAAGKRSLGSDDFNVGRVKDGHLIWWGWMHEQHPDEDLAAAAAGLGIEACAACGAHR